MRKFLVEKNTELRMDDGKIETDAAFERVWNGATVVSDDAVDAFESVEDGRFDDGSVKKLEELIFGFEQRGTFGNNADTDDGELMILEVSEEALVGERAGVESFDVEIGGAFRQRELLGIRR